MGTVAFLVSRVRRWPYLKGLLVSCVLGILIWLAFSPLRGAPVTNIGCREDIPCPYLGLQKSSELDEPWPSAIKCKPHRPDKVGCADAYEYYGCPRKVEDQKCDEVHYPDICAFRVAQSRDHKLSCDSKVCGSSDIQIGLTNPQQGKITKWKTLPKGPITGLVQEAVNANRKNGFGFLFIRCGDILQALTFPPMLQKVKDGGDRTGMISVNVIMLDSVSRPHFYRIMPRAVEALRKIERDPNIKATALDFELLQSVGEQTFDNLRPFLSGVMKDDNTVGDTAHTSKAPLGIEVLFGAFKKWGYQTLYQEDLCWFDRWGIGLTDLEMRSKPEQDSEFKTRWSEFQRKVRAKKINDFGLLHFSCTVLDKYHETNHFENPPQVCLNGQFFSQYFMDYIKMVYTAIKNDGRAKPLLSFIHFNTGHEYTGKRMRNMDAFFAKFLINMTAVPDAVTMVFSDHGNKNTQYSLYTKEGKREVFDPVFFMIVPDGVAGRLGMKRMAALTANQKRLFTLLDVHKALMSMNDPQKMNSQSFLDAGIFAVLPENRTCADLNLMPLTICKCEDFENTVEDNSESHKWLAEFALGTLNDAIQKQHMGGSDNTTKKYGYGNCKRLIGKSFTDIVQRSEGEYIMTTMNLHVVPPTGYEEDEVFKVSLKQYAQAKDKVWLTSYVRQSKYSKFESCADRSVDIKLCACAKGETADATKSGDATGNSVVPNEMFGSKTIVVDLHSGCLLFLRRNHGKVAVALEVTNICSNRTYKFELSGSSGERVYSRTLPINLELTPNTFYFLTSINRYTSKDSFPLHFEASVQVKDASSEVFTDLGKIDVS